MKMACMFIFLFNRKNLIKIFYKGAPQFGIADYYNKIEVWRNSTLNYQNSLSHIWDNFLPKSLSII